VFNNLLITNINNSVNSANVTLPANVSTSILAASPEFIYTLLSNSTQQAPVIQGYVKTLSSVFMVGVPFACLMFISSLFVKKERLSGGEELPLGA
jgi:hypothetical protein